MLFSWFFFIVCSPNFTRTRAHTHTRGNTYFIFMYDDNEIRISISISQGEIPLYPRNTHNNDANRVFSSEASSANHFILCTSFVHYHLTYLTTNLSTSYLLFTLFPPPPHAYLLQFIHFVTVTIRDTRQSQPA